jgi:hypothetical protein
MKRSGVACYVVLSLLLVAGVARADPPPPTDPPRDPGPSATGAPGDAPREGAPSSPGTAAPDDKGAPAGGELPGSGDATRPGKKPWPKVMYGLGVSAMFNIVPHFFLRAFTEAAQNKNYGLYQPAFGINFVRRKKLMDMTIRVMFGFFDLKDGNWLGRGHNFDETDYTEFHDMNFLWADITWTWHTRLAKQFYLAYGAGIGIGWVSGKVYTTPSLNCSRENYGDARLCQPSGLAGACTKEGCPRSALQGHPRAGAGEERAPGASGHQRADRPALRLLPLPLDAFRHGHLRARILVLPARSDGLVLIPDGG